MPTAHELAHSHRCLCGTYCAVLEPCTQLDAVRTRRPVPVPPWPDIPTKRQDLQRMVRLLRLDGFSTSQCATLSHWPRRVVTLARRSERLLRLDGPSWAFTRSLSHLMAAIQQPELARQYRSLSRIQFLRNRHFTTITSNP